MSHHRNTLTSTLKTTKGGDKVKESDKAAYNTYIAKVERVKQEARSWHNKFNAITAEAVCPPRHTFRPLSRQQKEQTPRWKLRTTRSSARGHPRGCWMRLPSCGCLLERQSSQRQSPDAPCTGAPPLTDKLASIKAWAARCSTNSVCRGLNF